MLLVGLLAAVTVAACGSSDSDSSGTTAAPAAEGSSTAAAEPTEEAAAPAGGEKEVRLLHVGRTNVGLWDPMHKKIYDPIAKEHGWNVQAAEAVPYGEADTVLSRWGDDKVPLVISTDSGYDPYVVKAAKKYPDTQWVVMSDLPSNEGLPNLSAYRPNFCDFGYLAGVTAGLVGKKKAGTMTGTPIPASEKWDAGFTQGVKDANPAMEVDIKKVGDWVDPANHAETGSALAQGGADVIWDASVINDVVAKRVQDDGKLYIGSFSESPYAPEAHVASVMTVYNNAYKEVAEQFDAGKIDPKINTISVKDGGLDVSPLRLGHEDKQPKLDEFKQKVADGEVTYSAKACADAQ